MSTWKISNRYLGPIGAGFFSLAMFFAFASGTHAERLPVKTYTVADGLLRDAVTKVRQDSRGFIWFCTAEGVSRFDGYSFKNFTTSDGLPERHVNDLLETRTGEIWMATGAGLARLNPRGLANSATDPLFTVLVPNDPKAKEINTLFEDDKGTLWVGSSNGLYRLADGGQLTSIDLGKPLAGADAIVINSIIQDRSGAVWAGSEDSGLYRILPSLQVERFTVSNGLPDGHIEALLEDENGRVWVGLSPHFESGLCLLVAEPKKDQRIVERVYREKDGLPSGWISSLFAEHGHLWIGTTRGLCLWQGGATGSVCKTYTAKNDLCDREVWGITNDKDGNLWTGSRCGAKKWAHYGFTSFGVNDGIPNGDVNSIFENTTGELFVSFNGDRGRSIGNFNGESFEWVTPKLPPTVHYFGWGWKQTVWQDHTGAWWIPTGDGVFQIPPTPRFRDLAQLPARRIVSGTKGSEVFRLFEDRTGNVWIATTGTANELWSWERASNTWHDHTQEAGFGASRIGLSFVNDNSGNLWIGTGGEDSALLRFRDGRFRAFTRGDGIPEGWMRDLFVDHGGRLWIANASAGLLGLDDVNSDRLGFVRYTPNEGLSSVAVTCVTEDTFGRVYVGTARGLDRLDPATGQIENFTTADGLPDSGVEVAFRDRSNNLWFGTSNGLARFVPAPEERRQLPNALITGLRIAGIAQAVSVLGESAIPTLELDSNQRQVTVDFLGLGTSPGEKLRYEYRFGNADWIPTTERTVNFANLAAGSYQFQVRAITADRLYSPPAGLSFRIATPLWQR
jgi:ligand-binding sensor domain-containing protein